MCYTRGMEETIHLCPKYERAFQLLGKRWTGLILRVLQNQPLRFSDIKTALKTISAKVLTERLKELESAEVIIKDDQVYRLTDKGRDLHQSLDEVQKWADRYE